MSRWSDIATWRPTEAHGGEAQECRGLVLHIAEGFYEGTIAWQHDKANKVSSHFVAGRALGELAQLVDTDEAAWTQRAGNGHWLSLECAGFTTTHRLHKTHPGWEKLSPWQIECAATLLARAHRQYGVPLQLATTSGSRGLGHHSMGGAAWGHLSCPGAPIIAQKAEILRLAKQHVDAPSTGGKEDDMPTVNDIWTAKFGEGDRRASPLERLTDTENAAAAAAAGVARLEAALADLKTLITKNAAPR